MHFSEERETIYLCLYSKNVHRTKCQALTIAKLTHSPYTTKIARKRCYIMLSTIFKCQGVQCTLGVSEGVGGIRGGGRVYMRVHISGGTHIPCPLCGYVPGGLQQGRSFSLFKVHHCHVTLCGTPRHSKACLICSGGNADTMVWRRGEEWIAALSS